MPDFDCIIVGAGVIGLAIARELSLSGQSVIILEKEGAVGTETSSRNSEVIHSGLYYPAGSLKALYCVEGNRLLYSYCYSKNIPYKKCGKLIVAADQSEIAGLRSLLLKGKNNGCDDLLLLDGEGVGVLEPKLNCVAALLSPSTGIIDSANYMLNLLGDAEASGANIAFCSPFIRAKISDGLFIVDVGGKEPAQISSHKFINASGLHASIVASGIDGLDSKFIPQTNYAKGNYFNLQRAAPFRHLIYPAPQIHGLGVHLTLDLGGQARFGPDVEWVTSIEYTVDARRSDSFYAAIRRYWPDLPSNSLMPAYSGIRPKICGPNDPAPDFRLDGPDFHGIDGLVNLFGIESPGLTSSLAIAKAVAIKIA